MVILRRLFEEGIEDMVDNESGRVSGLEVLMVLKNYKSRVTSI